MKLLHFFMDSFMNYGNLFFWIWTVAHAGLAVRFLWKLKPYELFIAVRYLKSRRKQMVISVIPVLSVLGHQLLKAFHRERQVRAALVAGHRVNLIDDQRARRLQHPAAAFAG